MRADRLLQIVQLLRVHDRLTTAELARRLEVTPRTIWRDVEALSAAGVPVYAERGRTGGLRLLPGYRPAVEELTAAETQALLLTGTGAATSLGLQSTLTTALRKLTGAVAPEHARAADRVSERILVDPSGWWGELDPIPHFAVVQQALVSDRRLMITYRPKDPAGSGTRTVDPYGLVQAAGVWYLLAAHRGHARTYRVSRVQSAEILDQPSRRPPGLDLRTLWQELRRSFAPPPTLSVRVEICDRRPQEAMIMLAGVGSARPRISEGTPMVLETEVLGLRAAAAALTGLGDRVRVLDPPELIDLLVETASSIRTLYGPPVAPPQ